MRRLLPRLLCLTALAGAVGIGSAAAQTAPPIKIGEINSYTGPVAAFTQAYRKGLDLAVEHINAKGGVLGRKLEVIYRDDNFSPADAVRMANELVLNQKVDLLAGSFLSPIAMAVANYAQQNKVLYVATEALTNQITWEKGSRYVFRVERPIGITTSALVDKAKELSCKAWVGTGPISEAITDMHNDFKAAMAKLKPGFNWTGEQFYPLGKMVPGATIDYLQRSGADCVLASQSGPDLISFLREGKARGFLEKVKVVGLNTGQPEWLETLGEDTPVTWIVSGYPWQSIEEPAHKKFVTDYQAKYGQPPYWGSFIGYLSGQAIAAGIAKAGSTDVEKMIQGFRGAEFDSILGKSRWRKDHQLDVGTWVGSLAVKDGKGVMDKWQYISAKDGLFNEEDGLKRRPAGAND